MPSLSQSHLAPQCAGCGLLRLHGGASWQPIADDLPTLAIAARAITPTNTAAFHAATKDAGLFRSDNAGGKLARASKQSDAEIR